MSTEMPLQSIFVQDQEPLHSVQSAAITTSVAGLNDIDDIRVQLQSAVNEIVDMRVQLQSAAIEIAEMRVQMQSAAIDIDDSTSNIQHRIFKVHDRLRRYNPEAYEPECVSIGPYHRGKVNLQVMQKHKERFLEELLKDPRAEPSSRERYKAALTDVEEQARRFYGDEISLSNKDDFVEMMLLDSCFIIEFLRKCGNSRLRVQEDGDIFNMPWLISALFLDQILFENQVPFFILLKLFDMTKFRDEGQQNLVQLALLTSLSYYNNPKQAAPNDDQVIHLLDLLYKIRTSSCAAKFTSATGDHDDGANTDAFIDYIKSTSEFEESGVKFEKATENAAWLDITWENGVMKIPQLLVYDNAECVLRNLIAYEQYCPERDQRTYIADYVIFMDLLINTPGDVKKLRHRQIIKNFLGDDEAVSTMFNKLAKDIVTDNTLFCYADVLKEVNKFSSKRRNIWRAKLMRIYFNTPWSIISILAAVVLLILTFLQTVLTVLSSEKN